MAIPKYKRENIDANVKTEQFGGMAQGAAAQGYAGIAQAQSGLAAQHGQRANQEIASFAQRLNAFSNQLDNMMRADASMKAGKAGIKDAATRRKEILDIQNKYRNDVPTMLEKIAEVETATEEDNFSVYGRIYQNQVNVAFASQMELDAATGAMKAERLANGNPEVFKSNYLAYMSKLLQGAPNELGYIAGEKAFQKHGVSTYESMYMAKDNAAKVQNSKNIDSNIEGLQGFIKYDASKGNTIKVKENLAQLKALVASQVNAKLMGAVEGAFIITEAETEAQTQEFMRYGAAASNSGMGRDFLTKIQNPEHPYGEEFSRLSQEVQSKVLGEMDKAINTYEENEAGKEKHENEVVRIHQETATRNLKENILITGVKATPEKLRTLEGDGTISATQVKEIVEFQNLKTDREKFMRYNDGIILIDMTTEDVMNLDSISFDDKTKLLKIRDGALKDPLYDWTKSRIGREAIRRLKEDYGITEDKWTIDYAHEEGQRTPKEIEYDKFRRQLFDEVQDMKYSDQVDGSMKVYNRLSGVYKQQDKERAELKEEADINRAYQRYEDRAEDFNANKRFYQSEVSASELMDRDVESGKISKGRRNILQRDRNTKPVEKIPLQKPSETKEPLTFNDYTNTEPYSAKAAEFGYARRGGSRSWRNKNPGNIEAGDFAQAHGATGTDGRFAIFPTEEAGRNAQIALLQSKNYKNLNIKQAIARYAPGFENNVPAYIAATGVTDLEKKMKDYTTKEMNSLIAAMKKHEGWKEGVQG